VREQGLDVSYSRVRTVVRQRLDHFDLIGDTAIFDTNHAAVEQLRSES
jgi:hypothetical protein